MKQLTIKANQTTTQQQQTGADHADATATAGQPVTGVVSAFHCQTDPFEQQSKVDLKTYPPNTTESANTYSFPHAVASLSDNYDSYYENQPTPSLQEPVYSVTANNAGNSTNTTKRCVMKVGCCICCTIVVLIVFLGILGAMVGDDDNDDADNDRGEHASPPLSPPPFTIPPSSLPTQTPGDDNNDNDNDASSTVPPTTIMPVLPTGPPVEIRVVNMTVETLIQGDTELVIQYNQLWWEKKDYYYYDGVAVPTIVNCQDLDDAAAATTELSSLCRAGTDLGSRPTLLFAVSIVPDNTNENQWSLTGLQANIREFPT